MRIEFRPKGAHAPSKKVTQYCYEYYAVTGIVPLIYEIIPLDYIIKGLGVSLFLGGVAFCFSIMAIIIGHVLIFSKYLKIKKEAFFSFFNIFAFSANVFHVGMMICLWIFLWKK